MTCLRAPRPTHSHGRVLEQADGIESGRVALNQAEPSGEVVTDRVAAHQMVHLALHGLLTLAHCRDTTGGITLAELLKTT